MADISGNAVRECDCPTCGGEGWVQLAPNDGEAPEDATTLCPDCEGAGKALATVVDEDSWEQIGLD